MERNIQTGARRAGEQGYMLLAMVVMVALVLISLAIAAPVVARDLRRDKEVESEHRADQYVRALRLYYRKFKSYPPSMEALEKSNNVRYLRKQYVDPLTGKTDWRIIHVGENQTTVKGFFGEPLGGLNTTGAGGSGLGSAAGMSSFGTSSTPGTSGTSINTGCSAATSAFCDQKTTTSTSGGSSAAGGAASGAAGGAGTAGGTGISSTSTSSLGSGGVGQIMGVGSSRSGGSILTPNQQESYDTWEFLYDPRIELMYAKSNILGGGIGSTSAASFGGDATTGKSNSGSGNVIGNGLPGMNGTGTGGGTTTPGSTTPTPP